MFSEQPPGGDPDRPSPPAVPPPYPTPGWPTPPASGVPGHGWGAPATPPPPAVPPPRGTGVRRPRKFWYTIGAVLVAIGVIGGITAFVVALVQITGQAPTDDHTFANNEATTVHIDAGASKAIYVTPTTTDANITCTARNLQGPANPDLSPYHSNLTVNQWRALFTLTVHDGGDYTISCSGPADARYGVGEHISSGEFAYPFIAAGTGIAVFIAGIVVLIVTAIRRHLSTRRAPLPYPPQQWPGQQ